MECQSWSEIIRVISKLNETAARVWFEIRPKLYNMQFNYQFFTAILKSQKSCSSNIVFFSLCQCFIDPVLSLFIKSCESCFSFSSNLIGYLKQVLKYDWMLCLIKVSKMPFKEKNGAIREWIVPMRANQI